MESSPWTRHYDETYGQYYWHNQATGESKWGEHEALDTLEQPQKHTHLLPPPASLSSSSSSSKHADREVYEERTPSFTSSPRRAESILAAAQQTNQEYSDDDDYADENNHDFDSEQGYGRPPTPAVDAPLPVKLAAVAAHAHVDKLHSRNNGNRNSGKGKSKKNRKSSRSYVNNIDDDDGGEDTTSLLSSGELKKGQSSFQESLVYSATRRDICCYSICIFVNAILIEGPLSAVEGFLRSGLFFMASFLVLIAAMITKHGQYYILCYCLVRECLLSFAGALSLSIPFMSCFAYRQYRMDVDWKLSTIPTIFGWVDCRRFGVFTYGNGYFASNVRYDGILEGDFDDGDEERTDEVAKRMGADNPTKHLRQRAKMVDRPSQDTWSGAILFEPRRVHVNLVLIVRGEDPLGILDQAD